MSRQFQHDLPRWKRVIAVAMLGVFCFQLSRVYLVVPLDAFACYSPVHTHGASSVPTHSHDHENAAAISHSDDERNYFQHCKDTLDGLGLSPAQPFGLSAALFYQSASEAWASCAKQIENVLENYPSPPFQPPRNLS